MKRKIEDFLLDYGALPTIFALEELASEEKYEEAALIKQVIDDYNTKHNGKIPTRYEEALIVYGIDYDDYTLSKVPEHAKKLKQRLCK